MATKYEMEKLGIAENERVLVYKVLWFDGWANNWTEKEYKRGHSAYKFANNLAYTNGSVRLEALIADEIGVKWVTLAEC